ncbi:hypothetical protein Q8G41_28450, partial [Klebsiella pneumoniae]
VVEALLVSHIINNNDAMGTTVVAACDGPKSLLASSIPDLQLYRLPILLNGADLKSTPIVLI